MRERGETEEKFLEEGEKKNKKVDGQRKRKPEKKHKWESRYRKNTKGKV
jgi:hypothetical protein